MSFELNIDALVGPTHNYSGLSYGNLASQEHQLSVSNPRLAALQGLEKMWFLASRGMKQAIFLPHERPSISTLMRLGYRGSDAEILAKVSKEQPEILRLVSSASAMWSANAATFSPSADCQDQKVHITPANLCSKFHRSIESETTSLLLKQIFPDTQYFIHHPPLPASANFSDEGAANHTRLCKKQGGPGINLFTFGKYTLKPNLYIPKIHPARQAYEACVAIARLHRLDPKQTMFIQQSPDAIDAGVFHNDVIAVGHRHCLLLHASAYVDCDSVIEEIQSKFKAEYYVDMHCIKIEEHEIPLKEAISTYLFNSQLVTLPNNQMALLAPEECNLNPRVSAYLNALFHDSSNPIAEIHYFNLRESMKNGGGPACLRLRAVLTQQEFAAMNHRFLLTEPLYNDLQAWIQKHYRDRLHPDDLSDPHLLLEAQTALDELTKIMQLDTFYSFQKHEI